MDNGNKQNYSLNFQNTKHCIDRFTGKKSIEKNAF